MNNCDCGSTAAYRHCCGRFLDGGEAAETAEQLMRSRYTGYVRERREYLLDNWHPLTRPAVIEFNPRQRWQGLKICNKVGGEINDSNGIVEFVARFKLNGKAGQIHESSRFVKVSGKWFYHDGDFV